VIFRLGCFTKFIILFILFILAILFFLNSQWFMKLIYPQPYEETVFEAGKRFNVDPYLITAIMRVESKFDERALSAKGARGLMQIIPETGQWVAQELKYDNFTADMLYEPKHNIIIGTWYLNYLIKQFEGNEIAAIASYNGGETNVKKWIKKGVWSGEFSDAQNIPFKETRKYLYKVIMDYQTYKNLYQE